MITNRFNVYLRLENGTGTVETGGCIASISGQAMAAASAWDGKIEIEEKGFMFAIGGGIDVKGFSSEMSMKTVEYVKRSYSDVVTGRMAIGAFCAPVDVS